MANPDKLDQDWMLRAACKGFDPNMWYEPTAEDPDIPAKNELARSICAVCLVQAECLAYSLIYERYGIWGGLDASQRQKIRQEKQINLVIRRPV